VANICHGAAPSVLDACSSRRSIASIERRIGPAKREHDAEMVGEPRADQTAAAEGQQQQIAGDDRRQHQR
jgi:hypothetical protein